MSGAIPQPSGLASVIIPCHNQLDFTRECIAALARHTRKPWELIAVDNGCSDGTRDYLNGVREVAPFHVQVITNSENRGFPAACNQGLRTARGEYLVLLNNDTVVTDAWLNQLVALAESDPKVGMTGPMSNYAPHPQHVEAVPYADLKEMHQFAARWRAEHRGKWQTVSKLSGFCLLIKRAVYEAIGALDERFGLGLFDDDDLSLRALRSGYELAVARDLFVHHFGSRTLAAKAAGIDATALFHTNRGLFVEKWGETAPVGKAVALKPWTGDRPPATRKSRSRRVSLTMIVRDEEQNLPACLESTEGLFDEIVVVDTGSSDRTVEIARSFGAIVSRFDWIDDFAAARNASLARATGDYVFWLDADDRIETAERDKLRALLDDLRPGKEAGYVLRCACDPSPGRQGASVVDHIRLFPLRDDVRWAYRVHEQILPSLRRAGIEVRRTHPTIRHTGYADAPLRQRKLDRDMRLLELELRDRPGDPFVLFNIGWIAIERKDPATALPHLKASLAASKPKDSITRKLHALIAQAHQMRGEMDDAIEACKEGLTHAPDDPEILFREGVVRRLNGDPNGAESCWRRVLERRARQTYFASVVAGLSSHLTRRNLAALLEERGDRNGAESLWREVLAECPADREATEAVLRLCGATTIGANIIATVNLPD